VTLGARVDTLACDRIEGEHDDRAPPLAASPLASHNRCHATGLRDRIDLSHESGMGLTWA
jgi:hypothetical protein